MAESLRNDGAGDTPYLSIVTASRNDDHGGKLLPRMQIFIDGLIDQCRRFDIPAELIVVEWNPPQDHPKLADALSWPAEPGPLAVRIIEVPPEIHARFEHAESLPLFQMIAKNVGIHRARGEFVLATNIDILFSDALMKQIAARQLLGECLYRIDRHDVAEAILTDDSAADKLDYCEKNVIRINQRNGTLYPQTGEFDRIYKSRLQVVALALAVTLVFPMVIYRSYLYWQKLYFRRLERQRPLFYGVKKFMRLQARKRPGGTLIVFGAVRTLAGMLLANFGHTLVKNWRRKTRNSFRRPKRFLRYRRHLRREPLEPLLVWNLETVGLVSIVLIRGQSRKLTRIRRELAQMRYHAWRDVVFELHRQRLHTNACGDFTLLSRDRWFRLRGYAEFEMYSFHIDSLLCHSATCLGIREHILRDPARIYHMEHSEGSGFTPETRQALWLRIAKSKIKRLSDDNFWTLTLDMRAKKRSPIFNNENWGLIRHDLPETDPTAPDMGQRIARSVSSGA